MIKKNKQNNKNIIKYIITKISIQLTNTADAHDVHKMAFKNIKLNQHKAEQKMFQNLCSYILYIKKAIMTKIYFNET